MLKEKNNLPEEQEIRKEDNSINSLGSSEAGCRLLSNKDGVLRLGIVGRVNTNTAPGIETDINEILAANEFDSLVLDFSGLAYISSAGIRVLLRLLKTYGDLRIENTSPEVYEILEVTGMTTLLPISKKMGEVSVGSEKMREFSVDGLEKIGAGFNGTVYRLDDETILKVINETIPLEDIQKERDTSQKAFLSGIPTAISYDVVKAGNQYGIIYELLNSQSYMNKLRENQDKLEELGKELGKFTHRVNSTVIDDTFDDIKQLQLAKIDRAKDVLGEDDHKMVRHLFEVIPESNTFVHGDLHPGNVLIQNDGALFLDMAFSGNSASGYGHPIFDLISFTQPVIGAVEDHPEEDFVSAFNGLTKKQNYELWDAYIKGYFDTEDEAYIEKVKEEILLRARAMKAIDLKYCAIMLQNQESAIVDGDDKRKIIRNLGVETMFKNVETAFQRIRATLEKKEDEFFFFAEK